MASPHHAIPYGEFRLGLLAESTSLAIMRRLTKWALQSWDLPDLVDDGVVIVNELATNAVEAAPDYWIELRIRRQPEGVLIECWDPSPALPPVPQTVADDAEGGRGLLVVTCLAARHGVAQVQDQRGKTVWALLSPQAAEVAA
jgi:anti-sigma regulatory factor (Ser/Thr protein kinase)